MKLIAITILLAAVVSANLCADTHPSAMNAINKFCSDQGIVVPSGYANTGAHGYNGGANNAHVWVTGSCNPAQWVPTRYCVEQFTEMCMNGGTTRGYGRNGCQTWHIAYAPAPAAAAPPKSITVHL